MDSLSFEKLAQETLSLAGARSDIFNPVIFDQYTGVPSSPGILYRLEKCMGTFTIRGMASENLLERYQEIISGEESAISEFKSKEIEPDELQVLELESYELAQIVSDQLLHRRFPIQEDYVCNVSDPGFSWWMENLENGIRIYFQSYGVDRASTKVQLGPLGDSEIAQKRFSIYEPVIRELFPVNEFSISPRSITITSSNKSNEKFQSFLEIFNSGVNNFYLSDFQGSDYSQTIYFYFQELAATRLLWKQVIEQIPNFD